MRIDRIWAMPNRWTFTIKPIKDLLKEEVMDGLWVDPFCGENSPAQIKNDLNPDNKFAQTHLDALDFLKTLPDNYCDGILFDPPYSPRQVSECYKGFGKEVTNETTRCDFYSKLKNEITRILKPNGLVICFGWNSMGCGKNRGFEMIRILLVPHGGSKNDTIVTVEVKINSPNTKE